MEATEIDASKRGWKEKLRRKWRRHKLINLDFQGVKDRFKAAKDLGINPDALVFGWELGSPSNATGAPHTIGMMWESELRQNLINNYPRRMNRVIQDIADYLKTHNKVLVEFGYEQEMDGYYFEREIRELLVVRGGANEK